MREFFGQFHPAVTHFPIALLIVAALAEASAWLLKRPVLRQVGAWNLHLGAVSAAVAAALGWALASTMSVEEELRDTLFWHRWLGTSVAVWGLLACLFWHLQERSQSTTRVLFYRIFLITGAVLVAISGHLGGLLVYGLDHYQWPFK